MSSLRFLERISADISILAEISTFSQFRNCFEFLTSLLKWNIWIEFMHWLLENCTNCNLVMCHPSFGPIPQFMSLNLLTETWLCTELNLIIVLTIIFLSSHWWIMPWAMFSEGILCVFEFFRNFSRNRFDSLLDCSISCL